MKKYLQFLKFALKEQREYKVNFLANIASMIINDSCFALIFIIFLGYFSETGLDFGNFLILMAIQTIAFGTVHGLLYNIGNLPEIIESGKLDYYLSFPIKTLPFLATNKVGIGELGDILFGIICLIIYALWFGNGPTGIIFLKGFIVIILSCICIMGIYFIVGSISFWLQKGSKVHELFVSIFTSLGEYPPEIYSNNRLVYFIVGLFLFPGVILPYKIILGTSTIFQWILFIVLTILIFILGVFVFKKGLKKYSSGSLIHQM